MGFISNKKLAELQKSVDELSQIVKTRELERLRAESQKLKEIEELLSNVKFKVREVKAFEGEEVGKTCIRIVYQLPTIILQMDDTGTVNKNDFFFSTNMLNMISFEDMKKIQDVIDANKKNN